MANRALIPTASRTPDIVGQDGVLRKAKAVTDYAFEIAYARLGGDMDRLTGSYATEWGLQMEGWALNEWQRRNFIEVDSEQVFITRDAVPGVVIGGTPDATIAGHPIEVKNPYNGVNHIETMYTGQVPAKYYSQVQAQIWLLSSDYGYFISADSRLPSPYDVYQIKVLADETWQANFIESMIQFETMIEQITTKLKELCSKTTTLS